ncbi:MAG: GIY-YIG nuclease family protein [Bacteroidia bacterium]
MKMFKLLYVYMLRCSDGSYYVGVTNDINRRIDEHNEGTNPDSFTFQRRPFELVYWQDFSNYHEAINWETQLKKWSRKKKEALIQEDWARVKELAACCIKQVIKTIRNDL